MQSSLQNRPSRYCVLRLETESLITITTWLVETWQVGSDVCKNVCDTCVTLRTCCKRRGRRTFVRWRLRVDWIRGIDEHWLRNRSNACSPSAAAAKQQSISSDTEFMSNASLIIEIMTTALVRSNFGWTRLSSAGYKTTHSNC